MFNFIGPLFLALDSFCVCVPVSESIILQEHKKQANQITFHRTRVMRIFFCSQNPLEVQVIMMGLLFASTTSLLSGCFKFAEARLQGANLEQRGNRDHDKVSMWY